MGFMSRFWNDYSSFASDGGPFRWAWMLVWTGIAVLLVIAGLKPITKFLMRVLLSPFIFVRFFGRSIAKGYREGKYGPDGSEAERRELMQRLAADIHQVTDSA